MNELYHHGILGMRWGIRRFQNKDGSLTPMGRERYQQLVERSFAYNNAKKYESERQENLKKHGVSSKDADTDILKKGMTVRRITNVQEDVDDRRKYTSITDRDRETYRNNADLLPMQNRTEPDYYEETYKVKKDIKIASAKNVTEHLLKEYGDTKVSELKKFKQQIERGYKPLHYFKDVTVAEVYDMLGDATKGDAPTAFEVYKDLTGRNVSLSKKDKKFLEDVSRREEEGRSILRGFYNENLTNVDKSSKIFKDFRDKGYDAVVDMEDYADFAEYPVIFLNPKESMKKVKSEKF